MIYLLKSFCIIIVLFFNRELISSFKNNESLPEKKIISKKKLLQRRQLYRSKKRSAKRKKKIRKVPIIENETVLQALPNQTVMDSFGKLLIIINRHIDQDIKKIGKKIISNIKNNKSIDSEIEDLTTQAVQKKYTDIEKLIQENTFTIKTYSEKIKLLENLHREDSPKNQVIPTQKKTLTFNKLESFVPAAPYKKEIIQHPSNTIINTIPRQSTNHKNKQIQENKPFKETKKREHFKIITDNKIKNLKIEPVDLSSQETLQKAISKELLSNRKNQEIMTIESTLQQQMEKIKSDFFDKINTVTEKNNIKTPEVLSILNNTKEFINQSQPIPGKLLQFFHPDSARLKNALPKSIKTEYFLPMNDYNQELKIITQEFNIIHSIKSKKEKDLELLHQTKSEIKRIENRHNPVSIETQNTSLPIEVEKKISLEFPQKKINEESEIKKKEFLKKGSGKRMQKVTLSAKNNNHSTEKINSNNNLKNFIKKKRKKLTEEKKFEEIRLKEQTKITEELNTERQKLEEEKKKNKNNFEKNYKEIIEKLDQDTKKIENDIITAKKSILPQQRIQENTHQIKIQTDNSLFLPDKENKIQILEQKIEYEKQKQLEAQQEKEKKIEQEIKQFKEQKKREQKKQSDEEKELKKELKKIQQSNNKAQEKNRKIQETEKIEQEKQKQIKQKADQQKKLLEEKEAKKIQDNQTKEKALQAIQKKFEKEKQKKKNNIEQNQKKLEDKKIKEKEKKQEKKEKKKQRQVEEQERKQLEEKKQAEQREKERQEQKQEQEKREQEEKQRQLEQEKKQQAREEQEKREQEEKQRQLEQEKKQQEKKRRLEEQERKQLEQKSREQEYQTEITETSRGRLINSEIGISEKYDLEFPILKNQSSDQINSKSNNPAYRAPLTSGSYPFSLLENKTYKINENNMSNGTFNLFPNFTTAQNSTDYFLTQYRNHPKVIGNNSTNLTNKALRTGLRITTKGKIKA